MGAHPGADQDQEGRVEALGAVSRWAVALPAIALWERPSPICLSNITDVMLLFRRGPTTTGNGPRGHGSDTAHPTRPTGSSTSATTPGRNGSPTHTTPLTPLWLPRTVGRRHLRRRRSSQAVGAQQWPLRCGFRVRRIPTDRIECRRVAHVRARSKSPCATTRADFMRS